MTVSVNPIQPRQESGQDDLFRALQLATSVYGVKLDKDRQSKLDDLAVQRYEQDKVDKAASVAGDQEFQMKKLAEEHRLKAQQSAIDAKNKASETKSSLKLPTSAVTDIADLKNVNNLIDSLEANYNKMAASRGSGLKSLITGSQADQFQKIRKLAVQSIGKPLEGGKMTDNDREYYDSIIPGSWTSPAQAKAMFSSLRETAGNKFANQLQTLKQAGYETDNFANPGVGNLQLGGVNDALNGLSERGKAAVAALAARNAAKNTAGK